MRETAPDHVSSAGVGTGISSEDILFGRQHCLMTLIVFISRHKCKSDQNLKLGTETLILFFVNFFLDEVLLCCQAEVQWRDLSSLQPLAP